MLKVNDLYKTYQVGKTTYEVLKGVSLEIEKGQFVAVMGPSGSGKTTLLNILAGLDTPTSGQVLLTGRDMTTVRESQMAAFRREHLGFVFQEFNLLDTFTVRDNIFLPLVLSGQRFADMQPKLTPLARRLGIEALLGKYPYEISGGQKQRVAVARALITGPQLILADEPTGALDSRSSEELLTLFDQINGSGQTLLMVTHSVRAACYASRVLFIKDGEVFHQLYRGGDSREAMFQKINDTLTMLTTGGDAQ